MRQRSLITLMLFVFSGTLTAQFSQHALDSINRLNTADHKLMMDKLGIESLRPGPSGDPNAPNAANSDESKVRSFELPELLNFNNGTTVSSVSQWEERRLEIYEAFDTEVYGRFPEKIPEVHWKVIAEKDSVIGQYPVVVQKLLGVVDNTSYPNIKVCIEMTLTLPTDYKKVPVILKFDW